MSTHCNEIVFISGASTGLGKAIAAIHVERGDQVIMCGRTKAALQSAACDMASLGPAPHVTVADVSSLQEIAEAVRSAVQLFGRIDRVYCNAGTNRTAEVGSGQGSASANSVAVATNVAGVVNTADAALQEFRRQNFGRLVFVSSQSSTRGMAGHFAVYAASKAFVSNLGEGLAMQYRGSEISVTTVHPGFVKTKMLDEIPFHPFAVPAERAARDVVVAVDKGRREISVPWFPWAFIRLLHRRLPFALARFIN